MPWARPIPAAVVPRVDAISRWVSAQCPQLQGKQRHNFAQVLRLADIQPELDLHVVPGVVQMAPLKGGYYIRCVFREQRGWQRATHISNHMYAQFLNGGRATKDEGLVGILRDREIKKGGYAGVYGLMTPHGHDVQGAAYLRDVMEKVANSPKNWCGVLIELRCRSYFERVIGGGVAAEEELCRNGVAAHASKSNGGRWLLPVPFLDLIGMWVPLRGILGDSLPGCFADFL